MAIPAFNRGENETNEEYAQRIDKIVEQGIAIIQEMNPELKPERVFDQESYDASMDFWQSHSFEDYSFVPG